MDEKNPIGQCEGKPAFDVIERPQHYCSHPSGVEQIELTMQMNFTTGSAFKYMHRKGIKGGSLSAAVIDLRKVKKFIEFEMQRLDDGGFPPQIKEPRRNPDGDFFHAIYFEHELCPVRKFLWDYNLRSHIPSLKAAYDVACYMVQEHKELVQTVGTWRAEQQSYDLARAGSLPISRIDWADLQGSLRPDLAFEEQHMLKPRCKSPDLAEAHMCAAMSSDDVEGVLCPEATEEVAEDDTAKDAEAIATAACASSGA